MCLFHCIFHRFGMLTLDISMVTRGEKEKTHLVNLKWKPRVNFLRSWVHKVTYQKGEFATVHEVRTPIEFAPSGLSPSLGVFVGRWERGVGGLGAGSSAGVSPPDPGLVPTAERGPWPTLWWPTALHNVSTPWPGPPAKQRVYTDNKYIHLERSTQFWE